MNRLAYMTATGCILMASTCFASAQDKQRDPKAIVRAAQEALKKVRLVRYHAEIQGKGWIAKRVPSISATVIVGERSQYDIDQFRCEAKITEDGSEEIIQLTAGCDGDVYFLIDPSTKTVYEDMDPAVLGKHGRNAQRPVLGAFAESDPLAELLESEDLVYKGTTDVAGEPCHEISAPGDFPKETLWAFSTKDSLPRRVIRIYPNRGDGPEDGETVMTLTKIEVNPKIKGNPFKLAVPKGFTKTDEFAP